MKDSTYGKPRHRLSIYIFMVKFNIPHIGSFTPGGGLM